MFKFYINEKIRYTNVIILNIALKKSIWYNFFIDWKQKKERCIILEILAIILALSSITMILTIMAVYQIKKAGMTVTDFWSFIKANELLDKLYAFSERYDRLSPQQQILFLQESEKIFDAFGKVPDALWEEEYNKYMEILNKYRDIKVLRWEAKDE